jgi:hypothetical protein
MNQTTTSIANTVPVVGGALSVGVCYAMLRSWGFSLAAITLMTILTGIWNSFLKLAMPIAAVALLALTGSSTAALLIPALLGVAILPAAALLFRLLTYGLQIPLGGFTYLIWQRNTSWRRPLHAEEPTPVPTPPN